MMQIGIRLHDVNTGLAPQLQTLERRVEKAREEGFSCVHLAFSKVIKGVTFDDCVLTEGLALYTRRVLDRGGLDTAVLGCYLNLAHPDPERLAEIQSRYYGHIRVAALMNAGVVGTETGAPNAEYKMDANTHTQEALDPVNLLYPGNIDQREQVIGDAIEKLGDKVAVVHLKDYVPAGDDLKSIAAGTGEMDYTQILRFVKERKPYIHATLENTTNENAVASREFLERAYEAI